MISESIGNFPMKIKVLITGSQVHDIGYRVFLLNHAMIFGLEGFMASNTIIHDDKQQIIVFAEGDKESIEEFCAEIKENKPPNAIVDSIITQPTEKRVMSIMHYVHLAQVEQLDKGIPAILGIESLQEQMLDKQDKMLDKQDETKNEIHALRSDLKTEMNERFNKIEHELEIMKESLIKHGIIA